MREEKEVVRAIKEWSKILSDMDIGRIFHNTALKQRALALHAEDACEIEDFTADVAAARVRGRTGLYWTSIFHEGTELSFHCSCPSDYYPCKHAGALLYTIRDLCLKDSEEDDLFSNETACRFRQQPLTPGELVEMIEAGSDGERLFDPKVLFFSKGKYREQTDSVSDDARFRPAFRLELNRDPHRPTDNILVIEAVLVYIRTDGGDGRLENFRPGKKRRPANASTEQLLRICALAGGRSTRARDVLRIWYAQSLRDGREELKPPVELYLERAERQEREKPVQLREVKRLLVKWSVARFRQNQIEYSPRLFLRDESGHEEFYDYSRMYWESDGELFLLSNPGTGSLWYLFDHGAAEDLSGRVNILQSAFLLPSFFGVAEARSFAKLCRRRCSGLIEAEELPEHIRILAVVPTPIVDFERADPSKSTDFSKNIESTSLQVSFRYGEKIECAPGSRNLIQLSRKEVSRLAGAHPDTDKSLYYIAPMRTAEEQFLDRLGSIITKQGFSVEVRHRMKAFVRNFRQAEAGHRLSQSSHFLIHGELYEVVSAVAGVFVSKGFEVRLQKEKIRRPPGPKLVRISASGENWLDMETGFETEDGFIPIENLHTRGIVEAGGKKYVLPPGADVEALLSLLRNKRIGRLDLAALEELFNEISNPEHPGLRDFLELRERLSSFTGLQKTAPPPNFNGRLRPYQENGLSWLWFLHSYGLGGCLADDMGLGKTIQTLALLAKAREAGEMKRALVVCPVSTLGNWRQEINTFTPQFSVQTHAGPGRAFSPEYFKGSDIVLVGYATMQRDAELLRQVEFDYLILDEAQAFKNPKTKRRKAAASLDIPHRIALTGTPIENSVVELWSLLDILMPGILGSRSKFTKRYGREIEESVESISTAEAGRSTESKSGSSGAFSGNSSETGANDAVLRLRRLIRPLILRRTKKSVIPELPPKEEFVHYAEAGKRQTEVYESLRLRFVDEVESLIQSGERAKSAFKILEGMLRLRQAAILPALVDRDFADVPSAKLDILYDRIEELRKEDNKALVFSQFTGVLDEVQRSLSDSAVQLFRLDGAIPQQQREREIAGFQACDGTAVFLISLKAGGLGINLTAADYVFLLDPWWNPAVESQAIDRAHRIGRRSPVFAYRLVTQGTIEEKMLRLQKKKRRISDSLIRGEGGGLRDLSNEDILGLFR